MTRGRSPISWGVGPRALMEDGGHWIMTLTVAIRDDPSPNVAGEDRSGRRYWADCRVRSALATFSSRFRNSHANSRPIYVLYQRPLRQERVPACAPRRSGGDADMRSGILSLLDPTAQDTLEATLFDCGETRGLRPDPLSLGALALLLNPAAEQVVKPLPAQTRSSPVSAFSCCSRSKA
jgi:hypothetical protein